MPVFGDDLPLPPPPPERIERIEESFARSLPDDYVAFVREHNGSKLAQPTVSTPVREIVIERFLPIVGNPAEDVGGWADVAVVATQLDARLSSSEDGIGLELVPFAALFGGDFLVLDYRGEGAVVPKVSIWFHESSEDFAPDARPIAPSFGDFINALP
ncbi:SMI1/KNR4 family protein [Qipengyuania qiaonensis]|uniref:SMI1/KNR4 family protein n=1 Tax=Qipengyuania qiaonensis TaxID=2867240 RepID=A0ABS7JAK5_9SPHN|nr:SMI1/KNR4 family protein [Qipengyuania qiaonensis]MBX7482728.1 SMI1/KNR4 family protein [Qipengyuania qiaonensis]